MENIKSLIKTGIGQLQEKASQALSTDSSPLIRAQYNDSVSVYKGIFTNEVAAIIITRIKAAFPALPDAFFGILASRIIDNNFCNERLTDAVNHVIDTCQYPNPSVAEFVSFDRKIKVLTYEDMLAKSNEMGHEIWESYRAVQFRNRAKKVWVHVNDVKMYNLTDEV